MAPTPNQDPKDVDCPFLEAERKFLDAERDKPEHWHLDKRVPIATLISIAVLAVGGLLHVTEIRKDVELLRTNQESIIDRINRQDNIHTSALNEVKNGMQRLDVKLDRLIERHQKIDQ
jgi:Tfp pilus assembly protein PilO